MKAVIYARYSSDNQREESIEGQLRENKAFAEKNGIEIVLLVGDFGANIEVKDIKNELSVLDGLIKESFFRNLGVDKKLYDVEAFNSFYTQSRDARNKLAHGLAMENVKFDNSMLFKFMASYYVLIQFYESICSTTE